ncbi:MAG: beta family protein [Gammaproteobacteria bacterium]|nr:beta family protein [Gammaproteobacteria bacterium]
MEIDKSIYVPVLKWRQGEYQALYKLKTKVKDKIVPLIVIPPIEYNFEERKMKHTPHEHIDPFPKKFCTKWGTRHALIDLHDSLEDKLMDDGETVIAHVFQSLLKEGCNITPVTGFSKSSGYQSDIKKILKGNDKGVAFRIFLEELMEPSLNNSINDLLKTLQIERKQVDLILDLEQPQSFEPYVTFSKALSHRIATIKQLSEYRSLVIIGTSLQLSEVSKPGGKVQRHEWGLYKELLTNLVNTGQTPSFGDYTIENPKFISGDMRLMKPAGKVVYTIADYWYVTKGKAFRGNESQMVDHCQSIINSGHFSGSDFSIGDKRISDTATGKEGTGNLSTWKQVGVNHHLTKVVEQLSNLHAA